nr:coat protein [Helleborus mosaic virus]
MATATALKRTDFANDEAYNKALADAERARMPNVPSVHGSKQDYELVGESDESLESRLASLKEYLMRQQKSKQFVNLGMEIGRPKLEPMAHLKPDMTNIFTRPTVDSLVKMQWREESGTVATAEELTEIAAKLQGLGVPPEEVAAVLWDISMYCASASSSESMDPKGVVTFRSGGSIMRDAVVAITRDFSTLRKVCRAYAPVTWNRMILLDNPPANWQAKGFSSATKFAAWDCFDHVRNPACVQPQEGLIRIPTREEEIAHATHKEIALMKNARNDRFANTSSEITGGKFGCNVKKQWRESKCD